MCASLLSVISLLAVLPAFASSLDAGNLHLQGLALPPEVITEALFSQVDATQDELEQCEETVRNLLREDPTQETSDTVEQSQDIAQKAVESFARGHSARDNSQNVRSPDKAGPETDDFAEESEEKSRGDSHHDDDESSEAENNSDHSDSHHDDDESSEAENNSDHSDNHEEEDGDEGVDVTASDRPSSSSEWSPAWTQSTVADEPTSPQTEVASSTTQTTATPGDEELPTTGVSQRRRKRSSAVESAEGGVEAIINLPRKTRGVAAVDRWKLSGHDQPGTLSQPKTVDAGPVRAMTKLQLLSLSRVGAEPQHSDRVRAERLATADSAQASPADADDDDVVARAPLRASVSSNQQNPPPPPVREIWRSRSAAPLQLQPIGGGAGGSHRRSRRSASGYHGNHDPTRFVPLIGQLVDRLTYLKRSLEVCRTLLKSGLIGTP